MGYVDWGFGNFWLNKWWTQKKLGMYPLTKLGFGKERPCPLCGRREDYLFPSGELILCDECAGRVFNQSDVKYSARRMFNIDGEMCFWCKKKFYLGWVVVTEICNNCTDRIGRNQKEIQQFRSRRGLYGARRIA